MFLIKKVNFFVFLLAFSLFLLSCSQNESDSFSEDGATLKSLAEIKARATNWSEEIEKDRLNRPIPSLNGLDSKLKLTPLSLSANLTKEKVYPYMGNFGLLDYSKSPEEVKSKISKFCLGIVQNTDVEELVNQNSKYELSFFYIDLEELFPIKEGKKRFESYKIGQSFETNDTCEIPVRFESGNKFLELKVYFILDKQDWTIDGFDFVRWEN